MQHWGGAQWVLLTLLVVSIVLPPLIRAAGLRDDRRGSQWLGAYLAGLTNKLGLTAILIWGGFWT